ncbi:Imm32 family immunity protein [Thermospira aquatica]|uniref:Immunity protein 32 n=1 Tax=Thermospira aquatica TaxID=2828656 RepID=A0AAX3BDE8_9SPIR|nr:Imm32 family immunity protein [Thermospira aquatica]URA10251.1 immunity protein 32 [Thermospira aquatica]
MVLTVELNRKDESIEIYCDKEGIKLLKKQLDILEKNGGHVHLMTPSWGGHELTEEKQDENNELINHLRIVLKPD